MEDRERRALETYGKLLRDRPEGEFRFRMLARDLGRVGAADLYDFARSAEGCTLSPAEARCADAALLLELAERKAGSYPFQAFERSSAERLRFHVAEIIGSPAVRALYDNYLDWHAAHELIVSEMGPKAGSGQVGGARPKLLALLGSEEKVDLVVRGQELYAQSEKKEVSTTLRPSEPDAAAPRTAIPGAGTSRTRPSSPGRIGQTRQRSTSSPARPAPAPRPAPLPSSEADAGKPAPSSAKAGRTVGCLIAIAAIVLAIAIPWIISCVEDMEYARFLDEMGSEPAETFDGHGYDFSDSAADLSSYDHKGVFGMMEDGVYESKKLGIRIEPDDRLTVSPFFDSSGVYDCEYWLFAENGYANCTIALSESYPQTDEYFRTITDGEGNHRYVEERLGDETYWMPAPEDSIDGVRDYYKTTGGKTANIFIMFDNEAALEEALSYIEPYPAE